MTYEQVKQIRRGVFKALVEKGRIENEAAQKALKDFVVDYPLNEDNLYTEAQMLLMFKAGVDFVQNWKEGPADIDEDKLAFIYNPKMDDYDVAWYKGVGKGTFYAYLEELMPRELYAKIVEHQIRNDIEWDEQDEKAYQEYLKEKEK